MNNVLRITFNYGLFNTELLLNIKQKIKRYAKGLVTK